MRKLFVPFVVVTLLLVTAIPTLAGEVLAAPRWRRVFPPISLPARTDHAMAYDTARGVAVLFGGAQNGIELNDTWEWSSLTRTWVERQPVHRPQERYGHTLTYDEARGVTVLFGGVGDLATELNDTWFWDSSDWSPASLTNAPGPRGFHSMAYDVQRQVVVLFGGEKDQVPSNETWEWNSIEWAAREVSVPPSARYGSALVYDSQRQVTVLFGGDDGIGWGTYFNDTWERTDGDWVQVFPTRRPPGRQRMAAAYSPDLQQMVIFGGLGSDTYLDETWVWDGQTWRTRTFNPRPSGRCCTAMVYDPVLQGLLLFGGSVSWVPANDTWIFR